ncbi:MAG TPA: ATP-binding protein [Pirellulales bacterium]|nr:ATP-binding protein [Pirellulales bacterium]
MSYNSFKRALGETSLERKCRFLFGFCLLVLIAGSFWWYGSRTEKLVYAQSPNNAQYLVDAVMLQRHWNAEGRDITQSSRDFINSTAKILQTHQEYQSRILIPDAANPENQPKTATEREVLDYFIHEVRPSDAALAGPPEWRDDRTSDKEYHYFQAVRLQKDCMRCHFSLSQHVVLGTAGLPAPPPPVPGDLMAVVEVTQPDAATQTALARNRAIFITTALVTVFMAMIASYVIVRYVIVKPLKHLRNVSDEVSRGNIDARAEIHTADEFEELGVAFNKMLRHLVAVQDELRSVNTNLDTKVDELAQANMRLYELNRLKSDFLATMSHELRTPLNSIIGFSDVLNSIKSLDEKQHRYVQNIQKSGRVLLDMINDILDLAKIESGKMELRLSEFRIEDAIAAQCDMARPLSERKNIDLEVEVEPNLPELFQDQGKVQQVLNNLLSNAIKFTPEGGRIVVSGHRERWSDRDQLAITVADTGVGIAEEDQVAIFEKFRQGKTALAGGDAMTREYSGTGLGLSIVKELCKLMGGEVSLASELGKGSTFTVRLPWIRADQPRMDSPLAENIDELLRPRRVELQRSLDRPVPAAPTIDSQS